jgi:prefoldin subunit 5
MVLMKDFHELKGNHQKQVKTLVSEHEKKIHSLDKKIKKIQKQGEKLMQHIQSFSAEKQKYLDELQELQKFMRKKR